MNATGTSPPPRDRSAENETLRPLRQEAARRDRKTNRRRPLARAASADRLVAAPLPQWDSPQRRPRSIVDGSSGGEGQPAAVHAASDERTNRQQRNGQRCRFKYSCGHFTVFVFDAPFHLHELNRARRLARRLLRGTTIPCRTSASRWKRFRQTPNGRLPADRGRRARSRRDETARGR